MEPNFSFIRPPPKIKFKLIMITFTDAALSITIPIKLTDESNLRGSNWKFSGANLEEASSAVGQSWAKLNCVRQVVRKLQLVFVDIIESDKWSNGSIDCFNFCQPSALCSIIRSAGRFNGNAK